MIEGEFDRKSGGGFVRVWLILPRLGLTQEARLPVDTGSSRSLLMPKDGVRTGLDFDRLNRGEMVVGIGGLVELSVEACTVLMRDDSGATLGFSIEVGIAPPENEYLELPSLLGRDVLNRMELVFDPPRSKLNLIAESFDFRVFPR